MHVTVNHPFYSLESSFEWVRRNSSTQSPPVDLNSQRQSLDAAAAIGRQSLDSCPIFPLNASIDLR